MTKTLLILRHAKSSWGDLTLADIDRPLNKRGMKAAPRMGKLLQDEGVIPELIISSTAQRCRETVELLTAACDFTGEIIWDPTLYGGGFQAYMDAIHRAPDDADPLMVVGHNPDLERLVDALTDVDIFLPTAALVRIGAPIDAWSELEATGDYELGDIWKPRELD
jgi:phosphohistidine phosphatase